MAASTDVYVVILDEKDVPGAKLPHEVVKNNSNHQLCRWLECRGLPRTGLRRDLIERVSLCLLSKTDFPIDVGLSVDGGKWHTMKLNNTLVSSNVTAGPPNSQTVNSSEKWASFKGSKSHPPKTFNFGNIYYHIVESVQSVNMFILPASHDLDSNVNELDSDTEDCGTVCDSRATDVHTSKPLKKGEMYFKSGHVQDMESYIELATSSYHVKSKVMASFKIKIMYNVSVELSTISGHVKGAACNCRASAMGRCNHVAAVLFSILDYCSQFTEDSPTSSTCTWNVGRKREKDPKKVSDILPYDNQVAKNLKMKLGTCDPRTPATRKRKLEEACINNFVTSLQWSSYHSQMNTCMWQNILKLSYGDFTLDSDQSLILHENVCSFLQNLKAEERSIGMPVCLVLNQATANWHAERSVRVTASGCHAVAHASSPKSITNILKNTLWCPDRSINTVAMKYGTENEPIARNTYSEIYESAHRYVASTGMWINPRFPELACSPDGLVIDQEVDDQYGLLEIKCPYILKGKPAKVFWKFLTKPQLASFFLKMENQTIKLKETHPYYYQIQLQMAITERKWCDLMVYTCPEKWPLVMRVNYNPDFCSNLIPKLVSFHHKYVCPEKFLMRIPRQLQPFAMQDD